MLAAGNESFVGDPPYQMYVQRWGRPDGTRKRSCPLVLVHGAGHTGVAWTSTPDGRPGWAPYFARQGWPVYVVDWPGVGRSGFAEDFLTMGSAPIVRVLVALLDRIGPSVMMGHSMGGAMAFLTADCAPDLVPGMILVTPSAPANIQVVRPAVPPDEPVWTDRPIALARFGSSKAPDGEAFEQYYRSLVPLSPSIMNAAYHQNRHFWIERPDVVRSRPILFIVADEDLTITPNLSEPAAAFLSVTPVKLGSDWGLPGHGHMVIIEPGNLLVAERVANWLEDHVH